VDGVTYPEIFADGMTGTFSSPSFQIDGTETVTITRPFSYSGVVNGFLLDPFVHGNTDPVFTKELFGRGTATATFFFTDFEAPIFTAKRSPLRLHRRRDGAGACDASSLWRRFCGAGTAPPWKRADTGLMTGDDG
jgi:hypothetical protein